MSGDEKGAWKMKKIFGISAILCILVMFAGSAWSYTILDGETYVGDKDFIIASDTFTPSYANELAWVQDELGPEYTFAEEDKYNVSEGNWSAVDGESTFYALDLKGEPAYFFLRIGTGGLNPTPLTHYLYENLQQLAWAVINLDEIYTAQNFDIGRISHVGEIGGLPVTEPTTLFLLGLGLIGLAGMRRK